MGKSVIHVESKLKSGISFLYFSNKNDYYISLNSNNFFIRLSNIANLVVFDYKFYYFWSLTFCEIDKAYENGYKLFKECVTESSTCGGNYPFKKIIGATEE